MLFFTKFISRLLVLIIILVSCSYSNINHSFYQKPVVGVNLQDDTTIGTGFIVNKNGTIITNHHVVYDPNLRRVTKKLTVTLYNNLSFKAETVYYWKHVDIAILKITDKHFTKFSKDYVMKMGDSNDIELSQPVIMVGSGKGLKHTFHHGIISGLHRDIEPLPWDTYYDGLIQVATSVNKGNSGGPLVTMDRKAVGVITLKIPNGENIGFAIPINLVKKILRDYKKKIKPDFTYSGLDFRPLYYHEMWDNALKSGNHVVISQVAFNGPGHTKDLKIGDVILSVNNKLPYNPSTIRGYISALDSGDPLNLKILRDGKKLAIKIKLTTVKDARKKGINIINIKGKPVIFPPFLLPPNFRVPSYLFKLYPGVPR